MKTVALVLLVALSCFPLLAQNVKKGLSKDIVPDDSTAIKIARAVWWPRYGEIIQKYEPYHVELIRNKVWRVYGVGPPDQKGGTPYIEIQKSDGKVLGVMITK